MIDHEIKNQCLDLMEATDAVIFGTVDGQGFPQTRAMANLRNTTQFPTLVDLFAKHEDDFLVYLTTDAQSHKFKQASANPKVSVYFCNTKEPGGLTLCGNIEIVTDDTLKKQLWQDCWTVHFPGGAGDPEYHILKLQPDFARCWFAGMKTPTEWKFK